MEFIKVMSNMEEATPEYIRNRGETGEHVHGWGGLIGGECGWGGLIGGEWRGEKRYCAGHK
jgi:hypothetical protein